MPGYERYVYGLAFCVLLIAGCDRSPQEGALALRNLQYNQFSEADNALKEKKFQTAIDLYSDIIDQQPKNAEAYARRGYAYSQARRDELTLQGYNTALEIDPENARAYAGRALYYASLRKPQQAQALRDAAKAIELSPAEADVYAIVGRAYYWLEEYEKALSLYEEALKRDAELTQAFSGKGLVYTVLGDYRQALENFDAALALFPDAALYNNRAVLSDLLGHYELAIENFQHAIELDPQFALGYANLGLAYINMWDFDEAEAHCQKSLKLDAYNCAAHYCLGRIYKASNDIALLEQALRHYTQVLEYGCEYFDENYTANAYVFRGQVKEALEFPANDVLEDFEAAIQHDPRHTYAYMMLGEYYDGEKAIAQYNTAITLSPTFAAAYLKRGAEYEAQGNFQVALTDFQQAAELASDTTWKEKAEERIKALQDFLQTPSAPLSQTVPPETSLEPSGAADTRPLPAQTSKDVPVQIMEDIP
jgi:tetratricopeptide (TPR) repeat protein